MAAPHIFSLHPSSDPPALVVLKVALRQAAIAARGGQDPASASRAGAALAEVVLSHGRPPRGAIVAGFWPMGDEIDIRPLLRRLERAGHVLALPVTPPRGQPLAFRRWHWGQALQPGRFGTSHPPDDAAVVSPDYLLVPLLAFDRLGGRLGYGGGYYDRTLAGLPKAQAIGVAFAIQEVPAVPCGPHDRMLPGIATEAGFIQTER